MEKEMMKYIVMKMTRKRSVTVKCEYPSSRSLAGEVGMEDAYGRGIEKDTASRFVTCFPLDFDRALAGSVTEALSMSPR